MNDMEKLVKILTDRKMTISMMESCTGGGFANAITNVVGASEVIKFSAVTYSNEFKIRMGVDSEIIDKYSVYSMETARDMSKKISDFSGSDYGVGITGKINRVDKNNMYGNDNMVFVSVYDKNKDKYYTMSIDTIETNRKENKDMIIKNIVKLMFSIF